jgi:ABC-2 type transport system permease protein
MSEHPFVQLFLSRLREVWREPGVLFWIFGFPILLAVGLGMAFRNKPQDEVAVGVLASARAEEVIGALRAQPGFDVERVEPQESERALRLGKLALVVVPGADGRENEFRFDPTRPDSAIARQRVDDALQRAAGRTDLLGVRETLITAPGARYIDFLIPGLLGMNIMSGGMWGIGFAIVEMRSRKLLKRLLATPMKRSHFLGAMMASRMVMVFAEMLLLLFFGWLVFDLVVQGSLWQVAAISIVGALSFACLGMLVASRTAKTETVSGLMNLVMLPMFVFSGVFFSSERFPEAIQPAVRALPLTALNDALRAVILEGSSLASQLSRLGILLAWGAAAFLASRRWFRWN